MKYAVKLLENILKIYSPTGRESELGEFLQETLMSFGFNVSIDDQGSVIGTIGEGVPHILFCGHMDTIPSKILVKSKDGILYGRGAVDAKGPLASMIIAAYEATQQKLQTKITVACLVDEEGESKGANNLLKIISPPDYVIFGEPSGTDSIVIGYKGMIRITCQIFTEPGHPASPWLFGNAIEEACELWNLIRSKFLSKHENSYFHAITGCLVGIKGGESSNTTPAHCILEMDIRIPPEYDSQQVYQELEKFVLNKTSHKKNIKIKMENKGSINAVLTSKDSPLVSAYSIAIRKLRDKQPTFLKKTGTCDMNVLAQHWNCPMIVYGPGDSRLDHTQNEHIDITDYLNSIHIQIEALKWLKKIHRKKACSSA